MSTNSPDAINWSLYFNITEGCNNSCCFCASNSPEQGNYSLSTEKIRMSLCKYSLDTNSQVVINGGEPTTHPGFIQILDCAIKTGGRIILFTNGRALANKIFFKNIDWRKLFRISTPIYSAKKDLHDRLVGKTGAWNQTMTGLNYLDLAREVGLGPSELELKLLAIRPSLGEWLGIIDEICKFKKHPERVVISGLILSKIILSHRLELIPSIDELVTPVNQAIRQLRTISINTIQLWSIPWCVLDKDNLEYFLNPDSREDHKILPRPFQEMYFDYRYPEGIELTSQVSTIPNSLPPECLNCKIPLPCVGKPEYLLLSN
jgi:hypothetical protein